MYREDAQNKIANSWNSVRKEIIDLAFNKMLFPQMRF